MERSAGIGGFLIFDVGFRIYEERNTCSYKLVYDG